MTEVPLSKALNPQLLPEHCSINGCPVHLVCVHSVCVHCCVRASDGLNAEHELQVWVTILGRMPRHFQKIAFCVILYPPYITIGQ